MNFQLLLKPLAFIGAATLLAGMVFATVYGVREITDPRLPDAYDHKVYRECVGTDLLFTYKVKDGRVETAFEPDSKLCGGEGTGAFTIILEDEGVVIGEDAETK